MDLNIENLTKACEVGDLNFVQEYIKSGGELNLCDSLDRSPLAAAALGHFKEIVWLLLYNGADPNLPSYRKWPVLHRVIDLGACFSEEVNLYGLESSRPELENNMEIIKMLVEYGGADINQPIPEIAESCAGNTPLDIAQTPHTEAYSYLKRLGAIHGENLS